MELYNRIRNRRIELGMSQDDLAKQLGYKSRSTIAKIESGENDIPQSKIKAFADALDISPSQLMGFEESPMINAMVKLDSPLLEGVLEQRGIPKRKGYIINVLGHVAAGIPIDAIEDIVDTEEISEKLGKTGTFFGLVIKGDSMTPGICDGDTVIVRQQDDAESGDIVIATVNGDEATCKRLRKYREGIELISNNPIYKPFEFTNEEIQTKPVKIIGKVVELRRKF